MAQPATTEAAQVGIQYSYFHWALHPWAMYAVVGLVVGYFSFRRDEPGLISPVFRPLIGDRVDGPWGKTIDVLAVLAVLFGVAVSLGQAGLLLTAGLGETFGTPTGIAVQLIVIVVTTVAFMISASTAIEKGINYLSQISMYLAGVLLVFFLVMGPTATQLGALTQGVGDYLGGIVPMSLRLDSFSPNNSWLGSWTVFYWSWWIAWCPYVGLFIARISRGRTIRQVVLGSMSTGGPQEPKRWIKLSWGVAMAAIAGVLLVAGGLGALQSASVLFGVPFAFIMVAMCAAFYMHLRSEARGEDRRKDVPPAPRATGAPSAEGPAPGQAFAAEEPAPGYNRNLGIEKPGTEGQR